MCLCVSDTERERERERERECDALLLRYSSSASSLPLSFVFSDAQDRCHFNTCACRVGAVSSSYSAFFPSLNIHFSLPLLLLLMMMMMMMSICEGKVLL